MSTVVLDIQDLVTVCSGREAGIVRPVDHVTLEINRGEIAGLVGESGSGKSSLVMSIIGLLAKNCRAISGSIYLDGELILGPDVSRQRAALGSKIGTVFQQPTASLDPTMRVGKQLDEVLRRHRPELNPQERHDRIRQTLERMSFERIDEVLRAYPHQLSGGMCQRISIALGVVCGPKLIIADEVTTALDVTTQAQVVSLLRTYAEDEDVALIFVTHDILLASELCDHLYVAYAGQIIEHGKTSDILRKPGHPYTYSLLRSVPSWSDHRVLEGIPGRPPDLTLDVFGCRFADRCPFVRSECREDDVEMYDLERGSQCRCVRHQTWPSELKRKGED